MKKIILFFLAILIVGLLIGAELDLFLRVNVICSLQKTLSVNQVLVVFSAMNFLLAGICVLIFMRLKPIDFLLVKLLNGVGAVTLALGLVTAYMVIVNKLEEHYNISDSLWLWSLIAAGTILVLVTFFALQPLKKYRQQQRSQTG